MRDRAPVPTRFARLFTACGAILFLASLGYFFVTYLTTFGAILPAAPAAGAIAWNITLFTLFAAHHSIFARGPVRRWVAKTVPAELERSLYVWIASLLFVAVCAWWRPIGGVAWQADGIVLWGLRACQAAGVWLSLRSAVYLDVRDLAGLPRSGHRPPATPEFRTAGPYGWVRHPIYAGWFLFVWSASPMTMTRFAFAAISCAYVLAAIPFEEREMRKVSAQDGGYERYAAQVRWRLLPGLY